MLVNIADELLQIVETSSKKFEKLNDKTVKTKPNPDKWSIQEILGHLIDSAANNHHRFVRAQETDVLVFPNYHQDHWVNVQGYNKCSWTELIDLWVLYNRHLAHVIAHIPDEKLKIECRIGPYEPVSLEYLAEDYLVHLKHHLKQIEEKSS